MKCVLCGRESEKIICDSCLKSLINERNLYFEFKPIKVCVSCGRVLYNNRWKSPSKDIFYRMLVSSLSLKSLSLNSLSDLLAFLKAHLKVVSFSKEDSSFIVDFTIGKIASSVEVPAEKTICPTCSISKSQFYAGILQVRNIPKGDLKIVDSTVNSCVESSGSFVTKREKVKGGVDYYITTMKALRKCADSLKSKFGANVSFNEKLFTRDSLRSKDVYKVNVLVRLSKFRVGDVIKKNNDIVLVKSTAGTGINLKTGKHVKVKDYEGWSKVDVHTALVLNTSPILIMDPLTFQSVEASNPLNLTLDKNKKVKVAFHNGEWFIVGFEDGKDEQ